MKHLIIPDGHAHPDYDNERFYRLGKLILAERPDVVICIGDLADMPSLSSYDKGTKGFEGRRYKKDLEAVWDAQEQLFHAVNKYNKMRAKNRKAQYSPRWVMTLGNHEDRINRAVNQDSALDGWVGMENLKYEEFGWEVNPFLKPVIIDEIAYAHYFVSGVASRPISGENIGKSLIAKNMMSSVAGHSHVFDHSERTRIDGTKLFGLSCGCYSHEDQIEGWNFATERMWWRGVVILDDVDGQGYYDHIRGVTMRKIYRDYS